MVVAVQLLQLVVIAWLPGAVAFRLPFWRREARERLDAAERIFWAVILSVCVSLAVAVALASIHQYSFRRLLLADILVSAGLAASARFRLRFTSGARRPRLTSLLPIALVLLGAWRFFPPSEYIIGGKDPGTYVSEGIQIAQRGTLVYRDPVVASVPAAFRDLFFPSHERSDYYSVRFMGFWIRNPETGAVVGQFPHLFPAAIAIGYGLQGLTGARAVTGVWAILGLLAVYFAARPVVGTAAAFAAAALLSLHVIEVWFGRYPNAEVVMQTLLFAAILAFSRSHRGGEHPDAFFAAVTGVLLGLLMFLRFDGVIGIAGVTAALLLVVLAGGRSSAGFFVTLGGALALAIPYYLGPLRGYADLPIVFLTHLRWWQYVLLAAAVAGAFTGLAAVRLRPGLAKRLVTLAPALISVALVAGAFHGLFLRHPAGRLAAHDAYALRTFTAYYATLPAVAAALIGCVLLARRSFWRSPALFTTAAIFCFFFFYKIRIHPEHFWMARRFLPVILPAVLVFACGAAAWGFQRAGARRILSLAIGAAFVFLLGSHFVRAAQPVLDHVEYAGIIPELERLAGRVGDDELLLVESRDAGSDAHVMALPLAYIYARNVLVLSSPRPDPSAFAAFLDWARTRYRRVYFLGGGGTELLSRHWSATSLTSQRFQVPEYESSSTAYPRFVRRKEFDFGLYELRSGDSGVPPTFDLDVGDRDDLNVVRFHAKEAFEGRTFRWSQRQSFVSVAALPPASRELVLEMSSGGRPAASDPAEVTVHLNDRLLGTLDVTDGFKSYMLEIPPDVVAAARTGQPARLRFVVPVWNPHETLGSADDRDLGVMIDRVQIR